MRAAVVLAVLAGLLATGCLGGRAPEPEVVVVTATPSANTQEIQDGTAEPTLTWNQWLGQQIADGRCDNPDHIVAYENENRTPPYSAVFSCGAPTPTPDAVATQVAATIAAMPTPTRRPTATPRPTRRQPWPTPTSTPRPRLLNSEQGVISVSPTDLQTDVPYSPSRATPVPTPTWAELLSTSPEGRSHMNHCRRNGGYFEIHSIQLIGKTWHWNSTCHPPPPEKVKERTTGLPDEKLLKCGMGVGAAIFTGDWLSALSCLGLLFD